MVMPVPQPIQVDCLLRLDCHCKSMQLHVIRILVCLFIATRHLQGLTLPDSAPKKLLHGWVDEAAGSHGACMHTSILSDLGIQQAEQSDRTEHLQIECSILMIL